jgi:hypothetical protein
MGEKDPMKMMQYTETSPMDYPTMAKSPVKSEEKASYKAPAEKMKTLTCLLFSLNLRASSSN